MSENNRYFMNKNELLANAEKAFEEKQFCVYYQPQYNYMSGRIVGAEALVRWIHPEYGISYFLRISSIRSIKSPLITSYLDTLNEMGTVFISVPLHLLIKLHISSKT